MGACAVNIDVVNILGLQSGIFKSGLHHQLGSQSFRVAGGDMISVATKTFAHHLGINLRATSLSMLQLLEYQASCAFGHHKSVARGAERTAGTFGLVVAGGKGFHGVETAHTAHADGALSTTGQNGVGLTQTNQVESISQSVARRCACTCCRVVGSVESKVDGDVTRSDVGNHLGNEERRKLGTVFNMLAIIGHFVFKSADAADAHTIDDSYAVLVFLLQIHAAVFHSLNGRDDGQLCIAVELAGFLAVNPVVDVQVFNLASKVGLAFRAVKLRNGSGATYTGQKVLPSLFWCISHRCNGSESSYDYSLYFHEKKIMYIKNEE